MRFHAPVAQLIRVVFALSFAIAVTGIKTSLMVKAQDDHPANLAQFDLLTASSGWVLLDQQIFWTLDAGQSWQEVGPSIPAGALVQDVEFKDASTGWIVWTIANTDDSIEFQLAHTIDSGITWTTRSLSIFEPG